MRRTGSWIRDWRVPSRARPVDDDPFDLVVQRRQMLAERLLTDILDVEWATVHMEAEVMAGAISPRVEERMWELLRRPGTCPHGNPIPDSPNAPDQSSAKRLLDAVGLVTVTRIGHEVEEDMEAMRLLQTAGLRPGELAEIRGSTPDGVDVAGSTADQVVPRRIARHLWVTPC